jgi:hypothetical protein
MPVYFFHRVSDASEIKIGSTNNLNIRMRKHASSFGEIKLFAQCAGGVATERLYQKAFAHLRTEGEWFSATDELREFISQNAEAVDAVFVSGVQKWTKRQTVSRSEEDVRIAAALLLIDVKKHPATTRIATAVEATFKTLHRMNDCWTRRRVRGIYDGEARKIELFEIIDLLNLAGIPRSEWPDIISPPDAFDAVTARQALAEDRHA